MVMNFLYYSSMWLYILHIPSLIFIPTFQSLFLGKRKWWILHELVARTPGFITVSAIKSLVEFNPLKK